jgi:hypothetical protein
MEIPRIHQQAQKHFREANYAAEAHKQMAWQEIPELKKEQRIHRQAILASVAVAAVNLDRRFEFIRRFQEEYSVERRVRSQIREKARQARGLERRLREATERATILTGLMRRARGGDTYAPHQADFVAKPQVTVYL